MITKIAEYSYFNLYYEDMNCMVRSTGRLELTVENLELSCEQWVGLIREAVAVGAYYFEPHQ